MFLNPELLRLAEWTIDQQVVAKKAFAPSSGIMQPPEGADGMPPAGGTPPPLPGSTPQGDPSQMAAQAQPAPAPAAPAPAAAPAQGGGKPAKPDIATVAMDIFHVKKLLQGLYNHLGIDLPDGILDGPHRHPSTGEAVPVASAVNPPAAAPAQPAPAGAPAGAAGPAVDPAMLMAKGAATDPKEKASLEIGSGYGNFLEDMRKTARASSAAAAILNRIGVNDARRSPQPAA